LGAQMTANALPSALDASAAGASSAWWNRR
jgi:hypothetical protein